MSQHALFRRQPVDQQFAQNLRTTVLPAPTRGIVLNENEAFMQPGGTLVQDNWTPTVRSVKLRGGSIRYCDLHALDSAAWLNNTAYVIGNVRYDGSDYSFWTCAVNHTSAVAGTFAADRILHPTFWTATAHTRLPVISAFEYQFGSTQRMYAAQATKLFDVTGTTPVLIASGRTSGNYASAQFANAAVSALGTNWLIACNDTGDYPLRFDGTTWVVLDPSAIIAWANNTAYVVNDVRYDVTDRSYWKCTTNHTSAAAGTFSADRIAHPTFWLPANASDGAGWIVGPIGTNVVNGLNLSYVWKYRNRLFFIEANSMNAWYLGINSVGGLLTQIPLAGSTTKGGKLLFGATWSMDAGDGIDEKCIFCTDQGEVIIFTGTNPSDAANWRQQGRYSISPPLGMNGHLQVGGDKLILTVDGIVPLTQAISKDAGQLDLAMLTRTIEIMWHSEVAAKRAWSWTIKKWDEQSSIFVSTPGGSPGNRCCLLVNNTTGAWARNVGWDATCFLRLRADMYFGTQDGFIAQAERTGLDDVYDASAQAIRTRPYVATLVGGWEAFGAPANQVVWHQARTSFRSTGGQPFQPQLASTVDYVVTIPPPPAPGADPGVQEVWDQGLWDVARWDQLTTAVAPVRNTLWQSIGQTGFAHALIVQVTVAQQAPPSVELIATSVTYEPAGVNV
jgi:hypothetical protein